MGLGSLTIIIKFTNDLYSVKHNKPNLSLLTGFQHTYKLTRATLSPPRSGAGLRKAVSRRLSG